MKQIFLAALLLGAAAVPASAGAQAPVSVQAISGTRLEISATGEATRVPDVAIITAGVVTRAGIADRDIQTSNISLNPEYRYIQDQAPQLTGYSASNQLSVRFRDIAKSGDILDALVAEGANSISGPNLTIDKPEEALDEARTKAVGVGRARAELYARALGMRVVRLVSVSESGGGYPVPPPMPVMMEARAQASSTKIDPGEQKLSVSLGMVFELR